MPLGRPPGSGNASKATKFKPQRPTKASASKTTRPSNADAVMDDSDSQSTETEASPTIPTELLTRLMHEFFEDDKMRIGKDANAVVAKYMETFVKEALHRAKAERSKVDGEKDSFLEVDDLEKLAPQLLLDF
ncbi:MAG: hypothetical protein M1833_002080 [Piccolia ochrophora]|nr:MAG: hypothetical protein M1833_002080 [Piccolia ochrophora]